MTTFSCQKLRDTQSQWQTDLLEAEKFAAAGLRYELAVCIATGDIVHFNGPFAPKGNPDICIFRYKLRDALDPGEQVLADKGYKGDIKVCTPFDAKSEEHRTAMSHARCRHETVNRRLKQWAALCYKFKSRFRPRKMICPGTGTDQTEVE